MIQNDRKPTIQTCYSPALYDLFHEENAIVVAVDILRATSAICTAFEHGVKSMIPVAGLEEAFEYKRNGYLVAAERNAVKQDGVDFGNSPLHYISPEIKGKTIVISTTNGTQAIEAAKGKATIVIGSFLNLSALAGWLSEQNRNILILCAGWKNKFNMEDSLFAGALANKLIESGEFETLCDSTIAAGYLYERASDNMFEFLGRSSHRHRLKDLDLEEDIKFCLQQDIFTSIPVFNGKELVNLKAIQEPV
ncbi:MAG: 2-phosphosulfolactate phosphatase [Bacteroidetes bacterium]|nr:2-phosphosulfolactate phosphatase [Bacteroidota bacterium]